MQFIQNIRLSSPQAPLFRPTIGRIIVGFAVALLCGLAFPLSADTVRLKSGASLEGKIVGQTRTTVRLRLPSGKVKVIQKRTIRTLKFGPVRDLKKEREEKRRKERERKRKEEARKRQEERRRREAEQKLRERKRRTEAQQEKERRRLEREEAERRRKEEANRYHAPPRHSLSLELAAGRGKYNPYAHTAAENLYNGLILLAPLTNADSNTIGTRMASIEANPNVRIQSIAMRYTWNAFFLELGLRKLMQDQNYNHFASEISRIPAAVQSTEFGQLRDPDPLIEMTSGLLGWSFWELPKLRLSLLLGYRRDWIDFSPEGVSIKQAVYLPAPFLTIPFDYGYFTKTKGGLLGIELDYEYSGKIHLRSRLNLLNQTGTSGAGNGQLYASTPGNTNQVVYRATGVRFDSTLKREGFAAMLEGGYEVLPAHLIGLRLSYWELRNSREIRTIQVHDDPSETRIDALQLSFFTKLGNIATSFLESNPREVERSVMFFYRWRYSFL